MPLLLIRACIPVTTDAIWRHAMFIQKTLQSSRMLAIDVALMIHITRSMKAWCLDMVRWMICHRDMTAYVVDVAL
jgi:hypothetical protein